MEDRFGLPQGTLNLLNRRVVAFRPIHGYTVARRLGRMSRQAPRLEEESHYPIFGRPKYRGVLTSSSQPAETMRESNFCELSFQGRPLFIRETQKGRCTGFILKRTLEGTS